MRSVIRHIKELRDQDERTKWLWLVSFSTLGGLLALVIFLYQMDHKVLAVADQNGVVKESDLRPDPVKIVAFGFQKISETTSYGLANSFVFFKDFLDPQVNVEKSSPRIFPKADQLDFSYDGLEKVPDTNLP
ncbi:MAG: hypothetical protein FJY91_00095 [Candidatus Harrisonbacteria bacterium]|nr:hypothetical protein [Candidatus Harrisonbacteria bacterium]